MSITELNIKKLTLVTALGLALSACAATGDDGLSSASSTTTSPGSTQTTVGGPTSVENLPRSCQHPKTRYSLDCTRHDRR